MWILSKKIQERVDYWYFKMLIIILVLFHPCKHKKYK